MRITIIIIQYWHAYNISSYPLQASGHDLTQQHVSNALAHSFREEIGLGAISKAGALSFGGDGAWVALAESKLQKDNQLDYQALLWELGSEVAEKQQVQQGGMNITLELSILENLEAWFLQGGGAMQFSHPNVTSEGFSLVATEDLEEDQTVLNVPLKLTMCRQTARNVLIAKKGKYLGEELSKTFERNEVWGMSIFLLHEYYKEFNGKGSKWGPFLRTLRMRSLTTDVLKELKGTYGRNREAVWGIISDCQGDDKEGFDLNSIRHTSTLTDRIPP